ncbi:hypothetical protein Vadar_029592 [Vaccinium darrowii]|uniref:Uncharacterized protein n=1 Tax=Vaccinium darrowii TaxID=229202 RepID=A0ACB7Y9N2_9ERIC|nr:hypothetical protein Vadar_029592 [Vaccinium darrowii]
MTKQLRTSALLLFSFLAAAALVTAVSGLGGGMVGGRTKVKDVKTNKEVQELGRYSVQQFNRMQKKAGKKNGGGYGGDLRFQEVVEAETQVVSGVEYYLKIAAVTAGGVPKTFDAVVVVKPWAHSKELLDFDPSPHTK